MNVLPDGKLDGRHDALTDAGLQVALAVHHTLSNTVLFIHKQCR